MTAALLAPLLLLAAQPAVPVAKRLELVAPAGGFVAGREDVVTIAAVDSAGALTQASGTPEVSGATGPVERIADGIWQVRVAPKGTGTLTASLDGATSRLDLKAIEPPVLTMRLNDTDLSPGERGTVIALVDVKSASGEPLDGVPPVVAATLGTAGAPKRIAPGRWSVGIRMADKKYPHASLVTASLPRRDVKPIAAAIALRGRAAIPIESEAGAKITVRIGKRTVGPLVVGASGQVEASIEAGPADRSMEVESLDAAGNRKTVDLPLDLPPFPRLWAAAHASPNGLDGRTRVTVHATALDRRGAKGGDAPKASVGGTTIALEGGDGVFTGAAVVALTPGAHTVTVSAGDEKLTFPITAAPAPAVGIALDVETTTLAMGAAPVAVTAYRVDAAGKRVLGGDAPKLAPEGLKMSGLSSSAETATAKVSPIEGKIPPATWIAARASGPGFALAARKIFTVLPGEPALVEILSIAPPRLPADGSSTALLEARVTDKWGNPVGGAKVTTTASAGKVVSTEEPVIGTYRMTIRAPSAPGSGAIGVTAGSVTKETVIAFVRPPSKWAVAAGAGGGSNLGALTSGIAFAEVRRSIGRGEEPFGLVFRATGSQGSFAVDTPAVGKYDVTVRQALLFVGGRKRFTSPFSGWSVAAAVQGGGGRIEVAEKNAVGTEVESGTAIGGRAAIAGERVMGRSAVVVEVGYSHVIGPDTLVRGNLGGAELTVGYRHGFK